MLPGGERWDRGRQLSFASMYAAPRSASWPLCSWETQPGVWTEAEDDLLALWQSRVGNKWSEVAKHIPGKTGQQCAQVSLPESFGDEADRRGSPKSTRHGCLRGCCPGSPCAYLPPIDRPPVSPLSQRWRHRVNPNISREKWTSEEDARLAVLVQKHGNSWAEIARRLPGRTGAAHALRLLLLVLPDAFSAARAAVSATAPYPLATSLQDLPFCQLPGAPMPPPPHPQTSSAWGGGGATWTPRFAASAGAPRRMTSCGSCMPSMVRGVRVSVQGGEGGSLECLAFDSGRER